MHDQEREQAQSLRTRLNDHSADIVQLAGEAAPLFHAAGSIVHVRWLDLELKGYGNAVDHAPLHDEQGCARSSRRWPSRRQPARAACVIGFREPHAALEMVPEMKR